MGALELFAAYLMRPLLRPLTRVDHALQDFVAGFGKWRWPIAHGTITDVHIHTSIPLYSTQLTYSYPAAGRRWSGSLVRQLVYEHLAQKYVASHAIGTPVVIRYDAHNPARSVLLGRDQPAFSADSEI